MEINYVEKNFNLGRKSVYLGKRTFSMADMKFNSPEYS